MRMKTYQRSSGFIAALAIGAAVGACGDTTSGSEDAAVTSPGDTRAPADTPGDGSGGVGTDGGGDTLDDPGEAIIDHDLWTLAEEPGPFEGVGPSELLCPEGGWYVEDGYVEVDTSLCNNVTLIQPLATALAAGDRLELLSWHGRLLSPDAASGTIAVAVGTQVLWREDVAIPSDGGLFSPVITVAQDVPAATPVRLHVHNHGFNTWTLVSIRRR